MHRERLSEPGRPVTRTARRVAFLRRIAFVVALAVAGCSGGEPGTPTASVLSPTGGLPSATAPTPVPPTSTPVATDAPLPLAVLRTADGAVEGNLGSYVIDGSGSDSPAYPFGSMVAVHVPGDAVLQVVLAGGEAIGDAYLALDPADDASGTLGQEAPGVARDADGTSVSFGPLPVGRWVLSARLFRADGRGDGVTYWAVVVE